MHVEVKNEDLKEFDNIVYINASDNSLSIGDVVAIKIKMQKVRPTKSCWVVSPEQWYLFVFTESFRSFGLLRELDLSLNGCCDMRFHPEAFPHLEVRWDLVVRGFYSSVSNPHVPSLADAFTTALLLPRSHCMSVDESHWLCMGRSRPMQSHCALWAVCSVGSVACVK